jgi:hypothetical protein
MPASELADFFDVDLLRDDHVSEVGDDGGQLLEGRRHLIRHQDVESGCRLRRGHVSAPIKKITRLGISCGTVADGGIAASLIAARRFPKRRWIDKPTTATGRVLTSPLGESSMVLIHPKAERRLRGLVALAATMRLEFVCAGCGYRIRVVEPPDGCPMCRQFARRSLELWPR